MKKKMKIKYGVRRMVVYTSQIVVIYTSMQLLRQQQYAKYNIQYYRLFVLARQDEDGILLMEMPKQQSDSDCIEQLCRGSMLFVGSVNFFQILVFMILGVILWKSKLLSSFKFSYNLKNRLVKFYFMHSDRQSSKKFWEK